MAESTSDLTLPIQITDIRIQKKNRNRHSLYHEKEFLVGVSSKTLVDLSLQKGVILTPSLFKQIEQAEHYNAIKEASFRYLGRRDHASFEIKQKLKKKGFDEDIIEHVLEELSDKGFLNDQHFSLKFITEKSELNQWGRKKIESELYKKGIQQKTIQETLNSFFDNLSQDQICLDLVIKRKRHFLREEDPYKRKMKIYNYLAGRGFTSADIKKAMPKIAKELDV